MKNAEVNAKPVLDKEVKRHLNAAKDHHDVLSEPHNKEATWAHDKHDYNLESHKS
jgi:hypothetical protein